MSIQTLLRCVISGALRAITKEKPRVYSGSQAYAATMWLPDLAHLQKSKRFQIFPILFFFFFKPLILGATKRMEDERKEIKKK